MKSRPYEKNKFDVTPDNKNNIPKINFLPNSSQLLKEKSTYDDSNNFMRSISNGNVDSKEDRSMSLYENDEFLFKELSELSHENSINDRIISERKYIQNNFHFKIPNSSNNFNHKNYNTSPEFLPSNFKQINITCNKNLIFSNNDQSSSSTSSPKNSSVSPKSNCNSLDNGQGNYFTQDKSSFPEISNIDLNESNNKSLKNMNILLTPPNSFIASNSSNPICFENSAAENGSEKLKDYCKNSELSKRKNSLLNTVNNSLLANTNTNSKCNNLNKYCLQTSPFIPKNLWEQQQQSRMNNYLNYIPSYNNFQFNNNNYGIYNNIGLSSAQSMYNYMPTYLNYDLRFTQLNSSPVLNSNFNPDNFEDIENLKLNGKENFPKNNLNNNKNYPLNVTAGNSSNNNNYALNSFEHNNNLNNKLINPINLKNSFNNLKDTNNAKPRINRNNSAEEPHNKINLENVN